MPNLFNFDTPVDRRNSDSEKWKRFGPDVLPLWVADMDFRSPLEVEEAIARRTHEGVFGYGDSAPRLREVYSERLRKNFNWKVSPEEITCTAGILGILFYLIRHLTKPGDGVLMFTPAYPPFFSIIQGEGRRLVDCPLREAVDGSRLEYSIDFESLEKVVDADTRLLLLCSPHNPVGKVFTKAELSQLADFCLRRNIFMISDEIHNELVFEAEHTPLATLSPEISAKCITLCGPSKTFNLPGLKVGHTVISDEKLRKEIYSSVAYIACGVSPLGAVGSLAAYEYGDAWLAELLNYLRANRDFAESFLKNKLPHCKITRPSGTYMSWLKMDAYASDDVPFERALKVGKVACGRGKDFGANYENYLRISVATQRSLLQEALERLVGSFQ